MELVTGVLSAVIAAMVSLVIALVSFMTNKHTLESEREKSERELQRSMTVKLYDKRLDVYPEAIAITDGLRKAHLWDSETTISKDYFDALLSKLDQWHGTKAFLLLSRNAVNALYELRQILREPPAANGSYSNEQLERLWRAKGAFRNALRSDIQFLYEEESRTFRDD